MHSCRTTHSTRVPCSQRAHARQCRQRAHARQCHAGYPKRNQAAHGLLQRRHQPPRRQRLRLLAECSASLPPCLMGFRVRLPVRAVAAHADLRGFDRSKSGRACCGALDVPRVALALARRLSRKLLQQFCGLCGLRGFRPGRALTRSAECARAGNGIYGYGVFGMGHGFTELVLWMY